MKIFPVKLMSGYDKAKNFMQILENSKHVHAKPSKTNKYGVSVDVNIKHYLNEYKLENILNKYRSSISELVKNLKRNHG